MIAIQQHWYQSLYLCVSVLVLLVHLLALQAFFRRGESFKELLKIPELQQSIDAMSRFMPVGGATARSDSYVQVLCVCVCVCV